MLRRSSLTLAAAAALTIPALAMPALAQTIDDTDTVGDMVVVTFDDKSGSLVPAPERTLNDVSRTRLRHGTRRVGIKVDYADLKRKAGETQILTVDMVTDEGVRRHLQLGARSQHWSGKTVMYNGAWRPVKCSVEHSIDYEANIVKLSFPRRCASNPRWVRFRVGSWVEFDEGLYIDDALRDRPLTDDDKGFKQSARVRRTPAN